MKDILRRFIIILLIGLMLISIFFILKNVKEDKEQEDIFNNLAEIVKENKKSEDKEKDINIENLYKENTDIVGWLKIENTNINYPVMQNKRYPNYYLRKNFYKKYSIWRNAIFSRKLQHRYK